MKHYFKDLQTNNTICVTEHRDGTASFKQGEVIKGRVKYITKTYKSYTSAKIALGRYTGGWAREIN